jgi:hypothetical protein
MFDVCGIKKDLRDINLLPFQEIPPKTPPVADAPAGVEGRPEKERTAVVNFHWGSGLTKLYALHRGKAPLYHVLEACGPRKPA